MEKTCSKCGLTKLIEEFAKSTQLKSGYHAHCKECDRKRKRESDDKIRAQDPEAYLARRRGYVKTYKENHPDRVKDGDRRQMLRNKWNITPEQYDEMGEKQDWKCLGCDSKPTNKRFAVDHDHNCCPGQKSCGKCLRGLLCSNCNTLLGLAKERIETLLNLIKYIEAHK